MELFQIAKLCTYCILKLDGNDLSGTCNYKPSKDCKMYEDIRNGKCTECLKSTGEEAKTREKPNPTDIPKLTDLLTTTNSMKAKTTTSNIQIKVILYKPCGCWDRFGWLDSFRVHEFLVLLIRYILQRLLLGS